MSGRCTKLRRLWWRLKWTWDDGAYMPPRGVDAEYDAAEDHRNAAGPSPVVLPQPAEEQR